MGSNPILGLAAIGSVARLRAEKDLNGRAEGRLRRAQRAYWKIGEQATRSAWVASR